MFRFNSDPTVTCMTCSALSGHIVSSCSGGSTQLIGHMTSVFESHPRLADWLFIWFKCSFIQLFEINQTTALYLIPSWISTDILDVHLIFFYTMGWFQPKDWIVSFGSITTRRRCIDYLCPKATKMFGKWTQTKLNSTTPLLDFFSLFLPKLLISAEANIAIVTVHIFSLRLALKTHLFLIFMFLW